MIAPYQGMPYVTMPGVITVWYRYRTSTATSTAGIYYSSININTTEYLQQYLLVYIYNSIYYRVSTAVSTGTYLQQYLLQSIYSSIYWYISTAVIYQVLIYIDSSIYYFEVSTGVYLQQYLLVYIYRCISCCQRVV